MKNIMIQFEDNLAQNIKDISKEIGKPKNYIINEAVKDWLNMHKKKSAIEYILNAPIIEEDFNGFEEFRKDLKEPDDKGAF